MVDPAQMLLWAAITGGTPLVIALLPLARARLSDRVTHLMLGLSAGILLGISLLNLLPESLDLGTQRGQSTNIVAAGAAVGFLVLLLIERGLLSADGRGHGHSEDGRTIQPFGTLAVSALTIHGLMDGFVIPLGFEAGAAGIVITLAVALHQIPDSFAAASVSITSTRSRRAAVALILATAIDTPIGIGLGLLFITTAGWLLPFGLAFSAGTFLFVSAADLIPELQHRSRSLIVTASIFVGFAGVAALMLLLPPV